MWRLLCLTCLVVVAVRAEAAVMQATMSDLYNLLQSTRDKYAASSQNTLKLLNLSPPSTPTPSDLPLSLPSPPSNSSTVFTPRYLATGAAVQEPPNPSLMVAQMPVPSPALSPLVSYVPPSTATFGCPTNYSVTKYGATGAGTNNDALAVSRANSAMPALYFPLRAGQSSATYLFASSITISKPIVVPCGTTLEVGPGATLTIATRPKIMCETRPTFAGSGAVAFTGAGGDEIHPVWFGQPNVDDAAAFQRAVDGCSSTCTVLLTRAMSLARPVALSWRTGVLATAGALLFPSTPRQGNGPWPQGGVVFTPGQYRRPVVLASTTSFEAHVTIQSGVTNAQLFAGVLQYGLDGIRLAPSAGQSISGTAVQNVVACSLLEVCVAVVAPASGAAARISNVVVRVNFVIAVTRAAVEFRGKVLPSLSRFGVIVQALDPNKMTASFQAVRNAMGSAVTGFIFSAETWAGGFMTPADNQGRLPSGQLVWGPWNSLSASFSLAAVDQMPPLNAFSNQGSNNYYGIPYIASAGYLLPLASSPSTAAVLPLYSVVYFAFSFRTAWKANESRTFYLLTPYAASVPASKMKCLVFNVYNPWLTCSQIVNNNAEVRNQVQVTLKNVSRSTMPGNNQYRFGLQVNV